MQATEFVLYCLGLSTVLIATATSIRLMRKPQAAAKSQPQTPGPKWEPIPDPTNDGLQNRLQAFQTTRYASPIVKRQLNDDAGPRPTGAPRPWPLPPPRMPPQRKKEEGDVLPFPTKTKKEPPKDGA